MANTNNGVLASKDIRTNGNSPSQHSIDSQDSMVAKIVEELNHLA